MTKSPSDEKWAPCPAPAVGDTLRWREPIWDKPSRPRGKPDKIGEQMVTATVATLGEPVELKVIDVQRLSLIDGAADVASKIQKNDMIRRKLSSLASGACQKLSQGA